MTTVERLLSPSKVRFVRTTVSPGLSWGTPMGGGRLLGAFVVDGLGRTALGVGFVEDQFRG
jgi:hypothetical protein